MEGTKGLALFTPTLPFHAQPPLSVGCDLSLREMEMNLDKNL